MVDVRPLLFVNVLLVMLLLTAGFAHVQNTSPELSGTQVPAASVSRLEAPSPKVEPNNIPSKESLISQTVTNSTIEQPIEQSPVATTSDSSENVISAPADAQGTITEVTVENSIDIATPAIQETAASAQETIASATEKPAEFKPAEPAVAKIKPSQPKAVVKPKPITGHLTVRSNVEGDVVLIDGVPQGSTKLDIDLPPGNYSVEVAKQGYVSWKSDVAVSLGDTQTLKARLEEYTSVEYSKGEWRNGVTTGEGVYFGQDGTEYHGSFVSGMFHGTGTVRYKDGTNYQGDWFQGKMQGDGTLVTATKDTYTGEFKDSKFNGQGTLTKANGDIYSGFWVNGTLNGQGTLTTTDGLLYVGGFSNNQFHGNGTLTFPDGRHYEGSFSKGIFHGKGEETYTNGKKYVGYFMDGQYHGEGELMNPNGSKIAGTFKFGKPFGRATLTTPEGEVFTANTNEPGICYREKSYRATECPPMEGW